MAVISLSEAARTWRIARSTLQRAIHEGRLSAMVRANGSKGMDIAELIRVFGEAPVALQGRGSSEVEHATPIAAASAIATLQAQVDLLQVQLQEARQRETCSKASSSSACYHRHAKELSSGLPSVSLVKADS